MKLGGDICVLPKAFKNQDKKGNRKGNSNSRKIFFFFLNPIFLHIKN